MRSDRVAVSAAAPVQIAQGKEGSEWLLRNAGANSIFVGPAGVTAANGFEVPAGQSLSLTSMSDREGLFAICAATLASEVHRLLR